MAVWTTQLRDGWFTASPLPCPPKPSRKMRLCPALALTFCIQTPRQPGLGNGDRRTCHKAGVTAHLEQGMGIKCLFYPREDSAGHWAFNGNNIKPFNALRVAESQSRQRKNICSHPTVRNLNNLKPSENKKQKISHLCSKPGGLIMMEMKLRTESPYNSADHPHPPYSN
ncbi:hypothetical protein E1301_Tti007798 [Triplophysa tibetana]|uniref:Uncharacterized protein n=1 Tax=Triplophysa tibetana TaxID=1572043 RepID=A0A5A9MY36_9TELE|nr:hypothetical protein E1301_Tti007798 [Triplophysa tibetana]